MVCPDCKGAGTIIASHVRYADGTGAFGVPFKCDRCGGTGQVDDRTAEWVKAGRQMRDARVNGQPYRNLRDEAARRGMDMVTLNRMERGIIEPIPDGGNDA